MFKKLIILVFSINSSFAVTSSTRPVVIPAMGSIEVAFSPNNGVTNSVVRAINLAKTSILVAAYSFTSKDISKALLNAKKRNVNVQIILDRSQVKARYSSATFFANMGFNLHIDYKHAIFHNKVMILDGNTVITGSFNFTTAAEKKNSENLLILRNNKELARVYTNEFNYNWNNSLTYSDFIKTKNITINNKE